MVRDESRYDDRATAEAARDAAPRGGRRTSGSGDAASGEASACGTETAGKSGFRLFTGDRVLWIIVAALAVISVLVVYSSTAKMAYDAHTARTTAHFLRQQLLLLVGHYAAHGCDFGELQKLGQRRRFHQEARSPRSIGDPNIFIYVSEVSLVCGNESFPRHRQ